MNREARRRLVQTVLEMYEQGDVLPAVPLERYLDGNTDNASLGRGMQRDFDLAAYAAVLRRVAARDDVTHVFVEVHEVPDVDEPLDDDLWAQAFVVHVVTSMSIPDLEAEVKSLVPRFIHEGWCTKDGIRPPLEAIERPFRPVRLEL